MSKMVVFGVPAHGHVNPTLPVVQELVDRGEQVIYYCHDDFGAQIAATGATFRSYLSSQLTSDVIAKSLENGSIADLVVLLLQATEYVVPFALAEIEREQPDLVIFDSIAFWGYIAANLLKCASVSFITHLVFDPKSTGLSVSKVLGMASQSIAPMMPLLAVRKRLIDTYGRSVFPRGDPMIPLRGDLNIFFTIRELQPDAPIIDESFHFVGPSLAPRQYGLASTFTIPREPYVYISLGTIHSSDVNFYRGCFEAFSGTEEHFLMSIGRTTEISSLGNIPANFSIYPYVPQLEVLQHALMFITHGGLNSVQESLYFGVPMAVVPHQFEQWLNGQMVAAAGACIVIEESLEKRKVAPETLQKAVTTLKTQNSFRHAAKGLQLKMRASGGFRMAADEIQRFLKNKQTS